MFGLGGLLVSTVLPVAFSGWWASMRTASSLCRDEEIKVIHAIDATRRSGRRRVVHGCRGARARADSEAEGAVGGLVGRADRIWRVLLALCAGILHAGHQRGVVRRDGRDQQFTARNTAQRRRTATCWWRGSTTRVPNTGPRAMTRSHGWRPLCCDWCVCASFFVRSSASAFARGLTAIVRTERETRPGLHARQNCYRHAVPEGCRITACHWWCSRCHLPARPQPPDRTGGQDQCGLSKEQTLTIQAAMAERNGTCCYNMTLSSSLDTGEI